MRHIAKVFMSGRSQAVRLPMEFRFNCEEVYVRRDPLTGDVVLSKKPESWDDFFKLTAEIGIPNDFLADRDNGPAQERDLF